MWVFFSLLAALSQWGLDAAALLSPMMVSRSPILGTGLLVAAGVYHTVGLRSDSTVVAVGDNDSGQCAVGDWTNIIRIAAGMSHTVGLTSDGTVVAVGSNDYGQCDVSRWTDIVQVAAGIYHTVGVRSDGTVVAAGDEIELAKWRL